MANDIKITKKKILTNKKEKAIKGYKKYVATKIAKNIPSFSLTMSKFVFT